MGENDDDDYSKFQTKKWHLMNDQNNGQYGLGNQNDSTIKFSTETLNPFLVDYSDAYILINAGVRVVGGNNNAKIEIKNCNPFTRSATHLNDEHIETAENLDLVMNLYNMIEYSDNFSDSTASMYNYKRPEQALDDAGIVTDLSDTSASFKYQSSLLKDITSTNRSKYRFRYCRCSQIVEEYKNYCAFKIFKLF